MKQKVLKAKTCKCCKEKFLPHRPLAYVCSPECAWSYARKQQEEKEAKEQNDKKKVLKENTQTQSDCVRIAQQVFNKYVRLRDQNQPCISCDGELRGKYDAGHYFSCGNYPALRFNEFNVFGQCVQCNQHKHGNLQEYRIRLENRIGIEMLEDLYQKRELPIKYSIPELKELIQLYKQKIKDLK